MPTKCRPILIPLLLILQLAICGCGIHQVALDTSGLVPLSPLKLPVTMSSDGHRQAVSSFKFYLEGHTQTLAYDGLAWTFGHVPCVMADSGNLVMLDTGMNFPGRATLDVIRKGHFPAHIGQPFNFAAISELKIGRTTAHQFPVIADIREWEYRVLGVPVYHARGWTLGTPLLATANYLAFDNRLEQVTIGFEKFQPPLDHQWASYEMTPSALGLPIIKIPVSGQDVELDPDSAGGPRLILDQDQWNAVAPHVQVEKFYTDQYPSWAGLQTIDVYVVRELTFGPLVFKDEPVWVRTGKKLETTPTVGLGLLRRDTAVWDFSGNRFWIGY
jgi:hypothetical protein